MRYMLVGTMAQRGAFVVGLAVGLAPEGPAQRLRRRVLAPSDGGFEEFRGSVFRCSSNSATRAFKRLFSSVSSITRFCRSPTRIISSAIVGSDMNLFSQTHERD